LRVVDTMRAAPPAGDDSHDDELVRRVTAQAPLALAVFLACAAVAAVLEFVRFPERRLAMGGVSVLYVLLAGSAYLVVRRRPAATIPVLIGFVNAIGVIINVYHAELDASVALCVWVLTGLLCSTAVLLPWGRRPQALASIGALLAYPLNLQAPSADPLTWAAGGAYLLCVAALSTFAAALFGRYIRKGLHLSATLSEREARLQTYFDLSLVGTAIVGPDGACREVNEEFCRLFGLAARDVVGRPWFDLVVDGEREVARGLLYQALGRVPGRMDFQCVRPDGQPLYASIAIRGLPGATQAIDHALVLVHDVTARRQAELDQAASLARVDAARRSAEAASRAKDEFLATVSHELRTPLTPILAWADMLHEGDLGADDTTRGLGVIQRSARTQARLVDDLLDMSRIVAGEWEVTREPVDLRTVLVAALDVVCPVADAKGVSLGHELGDETVVVSGDPDRLQQIVWNLLSNAIKFTPRGGRVGVVLEGAGETARIRVTDTGEGIPPDFLPHVFEPFRQADGSSTRRHEGLGLGLAIVRALVERHGGTVAATSNGAGATFVIELPRLAAATEATMNGTSGLGPGSAIRFGTGRRRALQGLRVLVVDDDEDSNTVVSTLLLTRGAAVQTARSAAEALTIADAWRPDVVVSDIAMPGEDGIALLRALQARRGTIGQVPTIALTALGSNADRRRLLDAGFQAHVAKPFDPVHLAAVVETTAHATAAA
jgi:PAS domain S-box-containing protein